MYSTERSRLMLLRILRILYCPAYSSVAAAPAAGTDSVAVHCPRYFSCICTRVLNGLEGLRWRDYAAVLC